jgi:hypothetical protein
MGFALGSEPGEGEINPLSELPPTAPAGITTTPQI